MKNISGVKLVHSSDKVLVGLAIEGVLIEMGNPVYEKVANLLSSRYKCQIADCYEHPEYLNNVLRTLYGNSYLTLVDKIREELDQVASRKSINNFLTLLSQ